MNAPASPTKTLLTLTSNPRPSSATPPPQHEHIGRILIAKHDPMAAEFIRQSVCVVDPTAEVVCCRTALAGLEALRTRPAHLGVFGLSFPDMDGLDLIEIVAHERLVWRLFVVSNRADERTTTFLREMRIDRFSENGPETIARLSDAIRRVAGGGRCSGAATLSPHSANGRPALQKLLTPRELLTFAIIGDGCDNDAAAALLGRSVHAVCWHRHRIARKLGISTRGELMQEAIRRGVVRISAGGVQRPGFERALSEQRTAVRSPAKTTG